MATLPSPSILAITLAAIATVDASTPAGSTRRTAPDGCSVSGSATSATDVSRARRACEHARVRFAELFGAPAPAALIVLQDEPGYEVGMAGDVGVVFWPNGNALQAGAATAPAGSARAESYWKEVLPHEVMHALTMARFFAGDDASAPGEYGTPLPDWFEEGIAIFGEPDGSRSRRLDHARRLPAPQRDLHGILAGTHPAAGNARLMAPVPGAPLPDDAALRAFYPQAIAVVAFVHHHGGSSAMAELGRRLRLEPAPKPGLAGLAGLPGLPAAEDAVVSLWEKWMAADVGP